MSANYANQVTGDNALDYLNRLYKALVEAHARGLFGEIHSSTRHPVKRRRNSLTKMPIIFESDDPIEQTDDTCSPPPNILYGSPDNYPHVLEAPTDLADNHISDFHIESRLRRLEATHEATKMRQAWLSHHT